jgi:UMF1 family MFS transporter
VSIGDTFRRLGTTLRRLRHYTTAFRFLLAYLVYMDAITTMTVFVAIYARDTGGLDLTHILGLFLISQLTAIPGALVLGRLADRIGSKTTLSLCLVLWMVILVLAGLARNWPMFIAVGLLSGIGIGSLQSVSRTMMSQVSPMEQQAEFFGFYAVAGRASAVVGPVLFGAISSLTGNQRLSIVALIVMIAGAFVLLQRVHDDGTALPGAFGPAAPHAAPTRP